MIENKKQTILTRIVKFLAWAVPTVITAVGVYYAVLQYYKEDETKQEIVQKQSVESSNHNNVNIVNNFGGSETPKQGNDTVVAKKQSSYETIQLQNLLGDPLANVRVRVGTGEYISDSNGFVTLTEKDRISTAILFSNNLYKLIDRKYSSDGFLEIIIAEKVPTSIEILSPEIGSEVNLNESPFITVMCYNGEVPSNNCSPFNKSTTFDFILNKNNTSTITECKLNTIDKFHLQIFSSPSGKIHIKPRIILDSGHYIESKTNHYVYAMKSVGSVELCNSVVNHTRIKKLPQGNGATFLPTPNSPVIATLLANAKFSESHFVDFEFYLFGNKSYIFLKFLGIKFKIIKYDKNIYITELFDGLKPVDNTHKITMRHAVTKETNNRLIVRAHHEDDLIKFKIDYTVDGVSYKTITKSYKYSSDYLKLERSIEVEVGTNLNSAQEKVVISNISVY